MVVHPKHRDCGVGGLMMEWGNKKNRRERHRRLSRSIWNRKTKLYEKWEYIVVTNIDFYVSRD